VLGISEQRRVAQRWLHSHSHHIHAKHLFYDENAFIEHRGKCMFHGRCCAIDPSTPDIAIIGRNHKPKRTQRDPDSLAMQETPVESNLNALYDYISDRKPLSFAVELPPRSNLQLKKVGGQTIANLLMSKVQGLGYAVATFTLSTKSWIDLHEDQIWMLGFGERAGMFPGFGV